METSTVHTAESVKAEIAKNIDRYRATMAAHSAHHPEFAWIPQAVAERLWTTGEWLEETLTAGGADKGTCEAQCHVLGQRSLFGDSYEWAARIANDYARGRALDRPGLELAGRITSENIGKVTP